MIGPIVGGIFVTYWSWRWIFLINVPAGIVLIALCLRFIPRDLDHGSHGRLALDLPGMAQLGAGTLAAMIGISYLGSADARPASLMFALPIAIAVVGFFLFWRHIRRVKNPFVSPRLLFGRGFGVMNVINFMWGGTSLGLGALIPLYATERYGIDALGSGTLLTTRGVASIVLSTLAAWALRRTRYRNPMYVGFAVTALGMVALAVSPAASLLSAYVWLVSVLANVRVLPSRVREGLVQRCRRY